MKNALLIVLTLAFAVNGFSQDVKSKSVKFKGATVNYYDIGDKRLDQALVLVHCWTCNAEFWRETYRAFPNYRVIAMDLPGHGTSDKPKVDYSIEYFARSVDAVMKKAGIKRAVLAGHSMGTPVIRRYYELYPKKVNALIIVDGALVPYGNRAELDKFFEPFYADYKTNAPKFVEGMLPKDEKMRIFVRSSMLSTPEHVATSAMRLMNEDSYAPHSKLDVPVLAVMAPSPYWPKDVEAKYRSIAPDLKFLMWDGTSHFLQMERPAEFNAAVAEFISSKRLL